MARISPPSKLLKALLSPPTMPLKLFSKTAKSCAIKLSPKFAPSPLPMTRIMTLLDPFSENALPGGTSSDLVRSRQHFGVGVNYEKFVQVPRSLKRWIFPVTVFGSSLQNRTSLGTLYETSRALTC